MKYILKFLKMIIIKPIRQFFFLTPFGGRFWIKLKSFLTKSLISPEELSLEERAEMVQRHDFYGADYFDGGKGTGNESGYREYVDYEKDANLARQAKNIFAPAVSLDIGCAKGFVVSEQRKLGLEAFGMDFSKYAVFNAEKSISPYLLIADCTAIPFKNDFFDLVTSYETLEHLDLNDCIRAMNELARIAKNFLWISTPCLGWNDLYFPPGWPQGKIKEEFVHLYEKEVDFPEPALLEHLALDRKGFPIEGHLTVASFRWWTENFINRGFIRRGDIEKKLAEAVYEIRMGGLNTMIFEKLKPSTEKTSLNDEKIVKIVQTEKQDIKMDLTDEIISEPLKFSPGLYTAEFVIELEGEVRDVPEWKKLAICDIRSKSGELILGFFTIYTRDMKGTKLKTFQARFGCNQPTVVEFRFRFPNNLGQTLHNQLSIKRI